MHWLSAEHMLQAVVRVLEKQVQVKTYAQYTAGKLPALVAYYHNIWHSYFPVLYLLCLVNEVLKSCHLCCACCASGPAPTLEDSLACSGQGLFMLVPVAGPEDDEVGGQQVHS